MTRLLIIALTLLTLAGCTASTQTAAPDHSATSQAPALPDPGQQRPTRHHTDQSAPVQVATQPADAATGVDPIQPVSVTAEHGTLQQVTLTNPDGKHVQGDFSADRRVWSVSEPLGYGRTYTWSGLAAGASGTHTPVHGRFTTVTPQRTISARFQYVSDNQTVGVGAPILVQFSGHIADRAAAERHMIVTASTPTPGSWAWLPDTDEGSRAHWRPEHYWRPGTTVDVALNVYGVKYDPTAYGAEDMTLHFTVGRSQITYGDVQSHRLVVKQGDSTVFDFPASYGLESDPNRNTPVGTYVTMEKYEIKYMSNPDYGYENIPEPWATRISNFGIFIHGNDSTIGYQGNTNVTHGCINLSSTNAKLYYDSALFGDPVQITDARTEAPQLSEADGDIYDWTIPWSQWRSMSALH